MHHVINRYVTIGYSIYACPSCSGVYIFTMLKKLLVSFVQAQKSHYSLVSVQSTQKFSLSFT